MVHHVELVMNDPWSHFHDPACIRCWPIEDRLKAWKILADRAVGLTPSRSTTRASNTPPPYAATHRRQKGALIQGQSYLMQFFN